ncbi:MAG: hypothetical protein RI988_3239 [Pseudomonadota bacterium]
MLSVMSLQSAQALRAAGAHPEAKALLVELIAENPSDPMLQDEAACVHDSLGDEAAAVLYCVAAIAAGLPEEELRGAYLGLGSTYRTLGRYGVRGSDTRPSAWHDTNLAFRVEVRWLKPPYLGVRPSRRYAHESAVAHREHPVVAPGPVDIEVLAREPFVVEAQAPQQRGAAGVLRPHVGLDAMQVHGG